VRELILPILAPEGAVAKITGKVGSRFAGPAKVYDSEEDMLHGLERNEIQKGDGIVIRYEGPKGGFIALVRTGDRITLDADENPLSVDVSQEELAARRAEWTMPPYKATRGSLAKYIRLVQNASLGCATDE
jgi:dihydroxy-acid dehydratase